MNIIHLRELIKMKEGAFLLLENEMEKKFWS